jgi:hypothetical protein
MRHTLLIGLTLLVSAAAVGAETPIPQDTVRMEKRRRDRLEWNRRTLQGAYDKVGKKDPRWDESARKVLDLAARMFSNEVDPVVTQADISKPAKAAVDAGCDDPLIRYFYSRSPVGPNQLGVNDALRRSREVDKALAASRYPAIRRMAALKTGATYMLWFKDPSDEVKKEVEGNFDAALALLDESVATDERNEFWEERWFDSLMELIRGYRTLGIAAPAAYQRVDARLAKLPEVKVLRLLVRGQFWYHYGWEARTNAVAVAVPEGGFESFGKRVEVAQEAFNEAWQLRPGTVVAATTLLEIDKAVGGNRATMELWFDRAMKADGDNRGACWSKLDWLDPKWHGSVEEMIAFGRACRDTKNWRAGITLLVADAHFRRAGMNGGREQLKYMGSPEVWSDIKTVYDEYLKHHPNDDVARSKFATFAYLSGHFPEAHAQYEALGDRLTQWSEFPYVPLEQLKRNRSHVAQIVSGKPGENGPKTKVGWGRLVAKNNEGQWSVDVPVKTERKQEAGILGARARNVWTCTAVGITYTLRIQPVPPALRAGKPAAVLDAARAAVAGERGGKARDEHAATLAEHPAQEYLIDAPALRPKVVRVRSAVIGNRLYELSVTATEADVSGTSATSFLDSFKFE